MCWSHTKAPGDATLNTKKIRKRDKGGKAVRFGGKGRLTDKVIDALQVFYGGAIRNHKKDLWAVYYHSVSTDLQPQHNH